MPDRSPNVRGPHKVPQWSEDTLWGVPVRTEAANPAARCFFSISYGDTGNPEMCCANTVLTSLPRGFKAANL